MGKKKPVTVGDLHFSKQGDALEFFKKILWKYSVGETIVGEDASHVANLLDLHRERDAKLGPGADHFEVMISDEGSRCLGVVQINKRKVGFSYKRCITQIWD